MATTSVPRTLTSGRLIPSSQTIEESFSIYIMLATQLAFFNNLFIPAQVHNYPSLQASELALRYIIVIIGQSINQSTNVSMNVISLGNPGTYFISLMEHFITQQQQLIQLAIQNGGITSSNNTIPPLIQQQINAMYNTINQVTSVFVDVGTGTDLPEIRTELYQFTNNIIAIIDSEVKAKYLSSIKFQTMNQLLALNVASDLVTKILGVQVLTFNTNDPLYTIYNIPPNINVQLLRNATGSM
jgi:hypothetical protein